MNTNEHKFLLGRGWIIGVMLLAVVGFARRGEAYIEAAYSLGAVVRDSTNVVLMKVESVDREKNTIIYRKVEDIKGKHPLELIKHNVAHAGFNPREWQNVMAWAAEGKLAVFCHNNGASETCIDNYWYQSYPASKGAASEWWNMYHGEPYLLRSFAGKPEKLAAAITAMVKGEDVIVPCMVDGDKNAIQLRTARIQRMRASLRLADYNPARDFAGWGGDEIRQVLDMAGFGQMSVLPKLEGGGGWGVATGSMDAAPGGRGVKKMDMVLFNDERVVVLKNEGEGSFDTVELPGEGKKPEAGGQKLEAGSQKPEDAGKPKTEGVNSAEYGARGAAWGDYNGTKRGSILLATPAGPKLLTNMGSGNFRDDSAGLPKWGYAGLTAAAWVKGSKADRPGMLLADSFSGLRFLENGVGETQGKELPAVKFEDVSEPAGLGSAGIGAGMKVADLIVADLVGDGGEEIIVNGADGKVIVLAFRGGKFAEMPVAGMSWGWKARVVVGDVDGDGRMDVVATGAGGTRVFKNVSGGGVLKFVDVTKKSGLEGAGGTSLAVVPCGGSQKPEAGTRGSRKCLDLVVGSVRGSNRYFRNDGAGVFKEVTSEVGLDRRIFNTRALAVLPTENGAADIVMVNEGQASAVLIWKKQ